MKRWRTWLPALIAVSALAAPYGPIFAQTSRAPEKLEKKEARDREGRLIYPEYAGLKKRIAVVDMEQKIVEETTIGGSVEGTTTATTTYTVSQANAYANGLTEMLTAELLNCKRFLVYERKRLNDILNEQKLGASGLGNPQTAAKIGNLAGVQILVAGHISALEFKAGKGGIKIGPLRVGQGDSEARIVLNIRLLDTTTGEILDSVEAAGSAKTKGNAFTFESGNFGFANADFQSSALGKASRQAVEKAVQFVTERMENRAWEGRIADLDGEGAKGSTIYINGGSRLGLKKDDEFEIFQPGAPITNPDDGKVIGHKRGRSLGRARVESVTEALAIAIVIEGEGKKNDVVRPVKP